MKTFTKSEKSKWLKIAQKHQDADRFVQGNWLQEGLDKEKMHRGCFFGCMMQKGEDVLTTASKEMSLPDWLIHIAEKIFEGLPKEEALLFPVQLLSAIPTNTDIRTIYRQYQYNILMEKTHGAIAFAQGRQDCIDAITQCSALFIGDEITESAASSAARSASSAARSASSAARSAESARSAAWSAWSARYSDWSATWSDWSARYSASSAESAAWSARSAWSDWSTLSTESAAMSAAEMSHWQRQRDMLLGLLSAS